MRGGESLEERMGEKIGHAISTLRLFWDEYLKVCLGFGSLGGVLLGVTVGVCLVESASILWPPLLALRGAVVGALLGMAMGDGFGAIFGLLTGSILIVGLAADSVTARSSPRMRVSSEASAEVTPAGAPVAGGDEPSPSRSPSPGTRTQDTAH
jgi:hypothetical protein